MNRRRWFAAALGAASCAGVLLACTFTQSLGYLQAGSGPPDVISETSTADVPDGATVRTPEVLVPGQTKPERLAQDANTLYWSAAGAIFSVPKSGGTPKKLGVVPPTSTFLAVDPDPSGSVFVIAGTDVIRIPKDGSDAGVVFKGAGGAPPPDTLAANESSLYVLQYDQSALIDGPRIVRMAKDGTGAVDIAPDSGPMTVSIDPKSVFWLDNNVDKPAFVEQAKAATPGSTTATYTLASDDPLPLLSTDIAVDDGAFFWVTSDATSQTALVVSRKREPVASVIPVYRGAADDTFANLTLDATHFYFFVTRAPAALLRVPKIGGAAEKLLEGLEAPSGLVVDATNIYLTVEGTGSTGKVLKLAK